ncbi:MAG: AAA family ATPase [Desulfomonilaceae bacterium]|nr:AAA family ATPase [Desulfomonilaceae bacterium]
MSWQAIYRDRPIPPRLEYLHVTNYRALHDLELKQIRPLSVFLGPNGSGKSTLFDVFAFLSECFSVGLRKAWDRRGRFKELRTRGGRGPITIDLKYREDPKSPLITYHLAIDERASGPYIREEWLRWRRGSKGRPFKFLDFSKGWGKVVSGEEPDRDEERIEEALDSDEMLAVNTLGQLKKHPRVAALRRFITGWYLSYLSADNLRTTPETGAQEHLSSTGDNLPNVIQYLREQHELKLNEIVVRLKRRVPRLEQIEARTLEDGRLLLLLKDAPFEKPMLSKYVSDGTLKMLAYLTVLFDPDPPELVGIEEPENHIHPRLLQGLAEECRNASAYSQLMVTTHSPFFVDGLRPDELWVLFRDNEGYTQARRASDMRGIKEFVKHGAGLGNLWMEGHFEVGDPLTFSGGPKS